MLNGIPDVQECDAIDDDSSNADDFIKINFRQKAIHNKEEKPVLK